MSEMHEIILDTTSKIFKDLSTKELIDEVEEGKWAGELWDVLTESGITSIGVSETLGGAGGDFVDAFHVLRLAGKYAVPLPLAETMMVNWLIAENGMSPQEEPVTLTIDLNNELEIETADGGYVLNGKLKNVSWLNGSKKVFALADFGKESVLALLPVEKAEIVEKNNLAGESIAELTFDDVNIEHLKLIEINREEMLKKVMEIGGLAKAVMMSGAMERILELTIQYTKERNQFGRPLHRLQAIQQQLAILSRETIGVIVSTNFAIEAFEKGVVTKEIANAKLQASQAVQTITEIAHQIHGAIGATHEHALHQFTRRLWTWRDEFGTENDWAMVIANQLLNSEETSLWELLTNVNEKETVQ